MPINLELIEDGYILWFRIEGSWEPREVAPVKEKTQRTFKEAKHTIHALVDLERASVNLPLLKATQQLIGGEQLPNTGHIAIVGVPRMIRMVAEPILRATSKEPISFFGSLEEAKNFLRRQIAPKQGTS